jgi:membrane-associated phospholipid phosphatase
MAELLTEDGEAADDLAWLYSDEVYEPSGLGGTPIPAPGLPERGEGAPRKWDASWRRFGLGHYILTGSALAVALGSSFIPAAPDRWRGRLGVDESVRNSISIEDYEAGTWARDTSDLLLSLSVAYPLLFDSLVVTYWYRSSHDVAKQMALITTEALSVATAIQGVTAGLASRERPYVRDCGDEIDERLDDCDGRKPYRSFFSGHTVMSFAAAGVSCSHHLRHQVLGDSSADGIACGAAFATAATVGTMRIVGGQHYFTDVMAGATIGTLSGIGIPWLLHYGSPARLPLNPLAGIKLNVNLVAVPNGLGVGGSF